MRNYFIFLFVLLFCVSCANSQPDKPEKVEVIVQNGIKIYGNRPVFKLTQNKVTVEKGTVVDPLSYLVAGSYRDIIVIKNVDTGVVDLQEIVYEVDGQQHALKVEVVDSMKSILPETVVTNQEQPEVIVEDQLEQVIPTSQPEPHTPTPEPEPEPIVPEPQLIESGNVGNSGMLFRFDEYGGERGAWDASRAWADGEVEKWINDLPNQVPETSTGYIILEVYYVDTMIPYGVKVDWKLK